jgi:hypothetical protein
MTDAIANGNSPASTLTKREEIAARVLAGLCSTTPYLVRPADLMKWTAAATELSDALLFRLAETEPAK